MAVQVSGRACRIGVTMVGLVAAGGLVAGCSSSGGGHPSSKDTSTGVTTPAGSATTPQSTTANTSSGVADIGTAFCSGFDDSALKGLESAGSAGTGLKAWDEYAKNAPSEIKKNVQNIDKYLHDLADRNITAVQQEMATVVADAQAVGAYYHAHCHS